MTSLGRPAHWPISRGGRSRDRFVPANVKIARSRVPYRCGSYSELAWSRRTSMCGRGYGQRPITGTTCVAAPIMRCAGMGTKIRSPWEKYLVPKPCAGAVRRCCRSMRPSGGASKARQRSRRLRHYVSDVPNLQNARTFLVSQRRRPRKSLTLCEQSIRHLWSMQTTSGRNSESCKKPGGARNCRKEAPQRPSRRERLPEAACQSRESGRVSRLRFEWFAAVCRALASIEVRYRLRRSATLIVCTCLGDSPGLGLPLHLQSRR